MQNRLIIISDLMGNPNNEGWVEAYANILKSGLLVEHLDTRKLAGIDLCLGSQEIIHSQFVNGGIDLATKALIRQNKEPAHVLAFSIGGTIAWKAALRGLKTKSLIAISSTRLRYEKEIPDCPTLLFYGENDLNKPKSNWFLNFKIPPVIIPHADHEMYKNSAFIKQISADLKAFLQAH